MGTSLGGGNRNQNKTTLGKDKSSEEVVRCWCCPPSSPARPVSMCIPLCGIKISTTEWKILIVFFIFAIAIPSMVVFCFVLFWLRLLLIGYLWIESVEKRQWGITERAPYKDLSWIFGFVLWLDFGYITKLYFPPYHEIYNIPFVGWLENLGQCVKSTY